MGSLEALSSLWMFIGPVVTGLAAMSGTVYVVAGAIVLLVTGIYLLYKNFDKLQDRFKPATDAMKRFANMGKSAVVGAFHTMIKEAEGLKPAFMKGFKDAQNVAITAIHKMQAESLKLWDRLGESHPQLVAGIESAYKTAVKTVSGFIHNAGKTVSDFFGKGLSDGLNSIVKGFMEQLKVGLSSFQGMVSLVAPFVAAIGLAFLGVSGPIGVAVGAILSFIGYLYRLGETNKGVMDFLKTAWENTIQVLNDFFTAFQPVLNLFSQAFNQLISNIIPIFQQISSRFGSTINQLVGNIVLFCAAFSQNLGNVLPVITTNISNFISMWLQFSMQFGSAIIQSVTNILPVFLSTLGQVLIALSKLAVSVLPIFLQVIQQVFPLILSVINGVLPIVTTLLVVLSGVILSIIQNILPILVQTIQLVFPMILSTVQQALPIIVQLIQLVGSTIQQLVVQVLPILLLAIQQVFPIIKQVILAVLPVIANIIRSVANIILEIARACSPTPYTSGTAGIPADHANHTSGPSGCCFSIAISGEYHHNCGHSGDPFHPKYRDCCVPGCALNNSSCT